MLIRSFIHLFMEVSPPYGQIKKQDNGTEIDAIVLVFAFKNKKKRTTEFHRRRCPLFFGMGYLLF